LNPSSPPVILIAFGEYDNLGVGYLSAVLNREGIEARMIDFRYDDEEILAAIKRHSPMVVGFSVVYEDYIDEFAALARYLRKGGVRSHFTAGGYFASLNPAELFRLIPELDSIVRFEGETTFPELVQRICAAGDWRDIRSIAFRDHNGIVMTPLRPLERDIDAFPFPARRPPDDYIPGVKFATLLASRGCRYNCSFCNTRDFFQTPGGPLKRIRRPETVLDEMEQLYHEKGCIVFLFQDDDFPIKNAGKNDWIKSFCLGLEQRGLHEKIMWKINCRPDEIEEESFAMMKHHGLFLVFIGLEDGTDEGLARLNKRMPASGNIVAVKTLKKLDIAFDYGFMLFQPESTFKSLKENLEFLSTLCGDDFTPVSVLKLMPSFNTRVEKELREQGRLKGSPGHLDYDFADSSLDTCYATVMECFAVWMWGANGLTNLSKHARNYFVVNEHLGKSGNGLKEQKEKFREILAESNHYLLGTMKSLFDLYESGNDPGEGSHTVEMIISEAKAKHQICSRGVRECFMPGG
jgi:radical SAM superfamily enzyme YgiQ (UPF0313 family)